MLLNALSGPSFDGVFLRVPSWDPMICEDCFMDPHKFLMPDPCCFCVPEKLKLVPSHEPALSFRLGDCSYVVVEE